MFFVVYSIACECKSKTISANKGRQDNKFVGFAIHNWGECFGKTQTEIDAIGLKTQTYRCTGSQDYNGCTANHAGCVGHDFADYVYMLSVPGVKGKYCKIIF